MIIKYTRRGGWKPPRDREVLEIAGDGSYTMWRSIGWATQPPSPIGLFAGSLGKDEYERLCRAADSAAKAGKLQITPKPDSPVETIKVGDVEATLGANDTPDGPWQELIERLRDLLGQLTASPEAALEVKVSSGGQKARLVHQGHNVLKVDLSNMEVRAVLWEDYLKQGDWRAQGGHSGDMARIEAGEGWSLDLPFEHEFDVTGGREVVAYVTFKAYDDTQAVPVSLQSPRVTKSD